MANIVNPNGFVPVGHLCAGLVPKARSYTMTSGAKVYRGDPIKVVTAGTVEVAAAGAAAIVIGIAAEYKYDSASTGTMSLLVYDDPFIIFEVQVKTGVTTTLANTMFKSSNVITYAAGSDVTYQSIMSLDTPATSANDWKIIGLVNRADNAWGNAARVLAIFNHHFFLNAATGI